MTGCDVLEITNAIIPVMTSQSSLSLSSRTSFGICSWTNRRCEFDVAVEKTWGQDSESSSDDGISSRSRVWWKKPSTLQLYFWACDDERLFDYPVAAALMSLPCSVQGHPELVSGSDLEPIEDTGWLLLVEKTWGQDSESSSDDGLWGFQNDLDLHTSVLTPLTFYNPFDPSARRPSWSIRTPVHSWLPTLLNPWLPPLCRDRLPAVVNYSKLWLINSEALVDRLSGKTY